jgi:VWFA-related protein
VTKPRTRRGLIGVVVAAALLQAHAQDAVFRSGVDLVTIDATVIAPSGQPVATLTAEDFVLTVDGERRPVVSAQFVSELPADDLPARPPSLHFATNESADPGRTVIVAVDEAHIRRLEGHVAFEAASTFIDALGRSDRVAVTSLLRADVVQFTTDRLAARRRLASFIGQGDPVFLQFNLGATEALEIADGSRARLSEVVQRECGRALTEYLSPARSADDAAGGRDACPEQVEQEARASAQFVRSQARMSLSALEALVASLARIEGPKTLVLLSEGLIAEPRYIDFSSLAAAAREARVSIYALHMDAPTFEAADRFVSPTRMRDQQLREDGLARLAGSARGAMFRLVGSDPAPFDRIRRETTGYYLLGFEPTGADRDGRQHRIGVSLIGKKGQVRARPTFMLPVVAASARAREDQLVMLLRASEIARDLPLRVATYTYAEPDTPNLRVVVSTEAEPAGSGRDVVLGYVLVDGAGVIVSSGAHRLASARHAFSTIVPPGYYTLRAAAIDALGRRGSLARPFAAAVHVAPAFRISDLIVAPEPEEPSQPLEPIVERLHGQRAAVYVELYTAAESPLTGVSARMEIASEGSEKALLAGDAAIVQQGERWGIARSVLPVGTLAPGRYVARAIITPAGGAVPIRLERPFVLAGGRQP